MADKAISQIPGLIYKKGGESYSFAKDRYGNYYSGNKDQNERIIYNHVFRFYDVFLPSDR